MATYVLMTKLGPQLMQDPRGREEVGREWKKRVKKLCPEVKWLTHYALLGPYDFMDIYETPNPDDALRVSLLCRSSGAVMAESWAATPYDQFLSLNQDVEDVIRVKDE